ADFHRPWSWCSTCSAQGIWHRGLNGSASGDLAQTRAMGEAVAPLAEMAWQRARRAGEGLRFALMHVVNSSPGRARSQNPVARPGAIQNPGSEIGPLAGRGIGGFRGQPAVGAD